MKSVRFEDSLFEDCYFEDIRSTDTYFENCTFRATTFYKTGEGLLIKSLSTKVWRAPDLRPVGEAYWCVISSDLYKENFIECTMDNTTFLHPKPGCHLNLEDENDVLIYLVSFLGSLAVLPGNIISALFMDKIGRIKIIGWLKYQISNLVFFTLLSSALWLVRR